MRRIEAEELTQLGESQHVEFKASLSQKTAAMKALCGMVNAESAHGTVVFGVDDDSTPVGIDAGDADKIQRRLAQHIDSMFDPRLSVEIELLECEGHRLLSVSGKRLPSIPLHEYDGRAFTREGSTTHRLSLDERTRLTRHRDRDQHNGPWKCDGCGSITDMRASVTVTSEGIKRNYDCSCGGEWWPA